MDLKDKKVTVVGLGVSGMAACQFLRGKEAIAGVTDNSGSPELRREAEALSANGVACQIGCHTEDFMEGTELVIISPGVEDSSLPVVWARERGVPIISEIELGYRFCRGKIVAVSGTNGKSTVTALIGEMLKRADRRAFICGNIGVPFTSVVDDITEGDAVVLEVSSFQLEGISEFRPHIAIMLNISEDHLDRYAGFDEYLKAKLRLFMNQEPGDHAILNYDQVRFRNLKAKLKAGVFYFSKHRLSKEYNGAYVENSELLVRRDGRYIWLSSADSISLKGEHNLENSLAAGTAALILGVEADIINNTLCNFKALDHRFEFIGAVGGVKFIDDSKATNVDSVYKAIQSSSKGIILIAGGRDKGSNYNSLAKPLKEKVKNLLLIGEAKERIADALSKNVPTAFAVDLKEAVKTAFAAAKAGDTVLLSPMCSSFDMFRDYKERGDVFRQAVRKLKN